jgi:ABC-type multidrug transport system fused ATPase/permease subunit
LESGIGYQLALVISMLVSAIGGIFVALFISWKLTLIMLCILPLILASSHGFSKVIISIVDQFNFYIFQQITANETMNELNTYSKAGQIVQEVFSSIRTVLSLNGGKFEQKR